MKLGHGYRAVVAAPHGLAGAVQQAPASPQVTTMRYKPLGGTGLLVSEIGLGTMTFGGRGFWTAIGTLEQGIADSIVTRALDAGVNFIDTADVYSEGLSEEITGQAIKNSGRSRSDIVLATKVFGQMGEGRNERGAS